MIPVEGVNYAAAALAFGAAFLWFISASVQPPRSFSIAVEITQSPWDGSASGGGSSLDLLNLADALKRQSQWNGRAAICAGFSAILTALAIAIGR